MSKRNKHRSGRKKTQSKKYSSKTNKPISGKHKPKKPKSNPKSGTNKIPLKLLVHHPGKRDLRLLVSDTSFEDIQLAEQLKRNIRKMGITHMTPIQKDAFNPVLNGNDTMGIARTGTGKTIGFLLPLIQRKLQFKEIGRVLILVPTRELALQVEETCRQLLEDTGMGSSCFIGGRSIKHDIEEIKNDSTFLVSTTGRMKDLLNRRYLDIRDVNVLVLDEYDRMLDMGFAKDVKLIISKMGERKQTLLFSATIDGKLKNIVHDLLEEPEIVKASSGKEVARTIRQDIVRYEANKKFDKLLDLLIDPSLEKVLIFCDTRRQVENLYEQLDSYAVPVDQIHGDKTQAYRKRALEKFKKGELRVLVATDVASRGLDIDEVSHVINYYIPFDYETYIHRIGRTGRAGKGGIAWTFVSA
ncbi:MAG: DEAD/DEAH box helicase [Saprospiraceae bacterium]|nr:DEAD/DEAH box helicase [Saprospiraceae bacterium]